MSKFDLIIDLMLFDLLIFLFARHLHQQGADDSIVNVDKLTCYEGLSLDSMKEFYGDDDEAHMLMPAPAPDSDDDDNEWVKWSWHRRLYVCICIYVSK